VATDISDLRMGAALQTDGGYVISPPSLSNSIAVQTTYTYRREITLSYSFLTHPVLNQVILIKLSGSNMDFSNAQADGTDVFFSLDSTPEQTSDYLSFERAYYDNSGEVAHFWLKLPRVYDGLKLYMFYGQSPVVDRQDVASTWSGHHSVLHGGTTGNKKTHPISGSYPNGEVLGQWFWDTDLNGPGTLDDGEYREYDDPVSGSDILSPLTHQTYPMSAFMGFKAVEFTLYKRSLQHHGGDEYDDQIAESYKDFKNGEIVQKITADYDDASVVAQATRAVAAKTARIYVDPVNQTYFLYNLTEAIGAYENGESVGDDRNTNAAAVTGTWVPAAGDWVVGRNTELEARILTVATPANCGSLAKATGEIIMEMRAGSPELLGATSKIEITSDDFLPVANGWALWNAVPALDIKRQYSTHNIPLSDASEYGTPVPTAISWFRWYTASDSPDNTFSNQSSRGMSFRNLRFRSVESYTDSTLKDETSNYNELMKEHTTDIETLTTGVVRHAAGFKGDSYTHRMRFASTDWIARNNWTYSVWFRPETNSSYHATTWPMALLHSDYVPDPDAASVFYKLVSLVATVNSTPASGKIEFTWDGIKILDTAYTFNVDTWYNIVLVKDDSRNEWRLYINGTSLAIAASARMVQDFPYPLYIGGETAALAEGFKGRLSEFVFSSRAYTEDEVLVRYNTTLGNNISVGSEVSGAAITKPHGLALDLDDGGKLYVSDWKL